MLTNVEAAKVIESFGHGKLPSGCLLWMLNNRLREEIIIAPTTSETQVNPIPKIYYLKSDDDHNLEAFKCM